MTTEPFIYQGRIVHSLTLTQLEFIEDGILVIVNGRIAELQRFNNSDQLQQLITQYKVNPENVFKLEPEQFLIPGLIDTHIHAPQYPNVGLGYDLPLLQWLDKYTFPLEEKYSEKTFASQVYNAVVKNTISCGTTTASYYATIHTETALILAQAAVNNNQRAFIGKVNMNVSTRPALLETLQQTLDQTQIFLQQFPTSDIVKPVITPRFALSCDMEAMSGLASLAAKNDVSIQTHISENQEEVQAVADTYPQCSSYADVYNSAGLLTNKTVLAHGVYLTETEMEIIKQSGSAIAHCPNSNISLQSGLCPVRKLLNAGLKVGLGTDCAGGYSVSMMDSMRQTLQTSIAVSFTDQNMTRLTETEVFYLATLGGAQALNVEKDVGNFLTGKAFDALLIDMTKNPTIDLLDEFTFLQLFQKFIYLGDDRNVQKVYVNGKLSINKTLK